MSYVHLPAANRATLRHRIGEAVESLLAILDALDGDRDAEDDGTAEPSLGWTRTMASGSADDREEDATPVSELFRAKPTRRCAPNCAQKLPVKF